MRRRARSPRNGWRLAGMAGLALALLGAGGARAADAPAPLQGPHYGDSLFRSFQEHDFSALTALMVAQHFGRVSPQAGHAELLRARLLLSYGLDREAGEIFAGLIDKGAAPALRDIAWYHLAKIRYQRGLTREAEDTIGRIAGRLSAELEQDRLLLHANLSMARADFAGAARLLEGVNSATGAGAYARYNLGVALIRSGDAKRGSAVLDELGQVPAESEELRSLRDEANVALGFAALQQDNPRSSSFFLARVRLDGLHSGKALLGFGWAAAAQKNYRQALVPWSELSGREGSDPAVLEARIALPYAYAELDAHAQALQRYNEALVAFEREGGKLDASIAAIRAGKLLDALIERGAGQESGWPASLGALPEVPHAGQLAQLFAGHEFQAAFRSYRDLHLLAANLQDWQDRLGVQEDLLASRRQAFAERLPRARAKAGAVELRALQQRRDALAAELARARAEPDGYAFADATERELLARLQSVREALGQAEADAPALSTARERARRAGGALIWRLAQQYPARAQAASQALETIDRELAQARGRDAALAQAERDEPQRIERFARRNTELAQRIRGLLVRVATLKGEQRIHAQELAVAELLRRKERLAVYATQARFAVVQLHDRATSMSRRPDAKTKTR